MAPIMLQRQLDSLHRCLMRIEEKCPASVRQLQNVPDLQGIVVLNLSHAVQVCVDTALHLLTEAGQPTPETMGDAFEKLARSNHLDPELSRRMRKAVGFRNIAAHNSAPFDWAIVHAIATEHLGDFKDFARSVAASNTP